MKKCISIAFMAIGGIFLPSWVQAQDGGLAGSINSLRSVLDQVYNDMIPLCSQLTGVGRGIGAFAALWYIAVRVWRHISHAEAIDFFPLFRPFVIGFAITIFPSVIALINSIMQPTVTGTEALVSNSDAAIAALLKAKEDAVLKSDAWQMYVGTTGEGDRDKWYRYTHDDQAPSGEGFWASIGNNVRFAMAKASYNFRNSIKEWMSQVLEVLFAAAALCINTLRTFNLIILAVIGPLAFAISIFDGFGHTLKHWLARYLNVYLWLPVANIFGALIGKIQENMLKLDLSQISQTGDTFFSSTDMAYLVFLIIGIIGYMTVPSIANQIIWVGGGDALTSKTTGMVGAAVGATATGANMLAGAGAHAAGRGSDAAGSLMFGDHNSAAAGVRNAGHAPGNIHSGYKEASTGKGFAASAGRTYGRVSHYLRDKLSGNN